MRGDNNGDDGFFDDWEEFYRVTRFLVAVIIGIDGEHDHKKIAEEEIMNHLYETCDSLLRERQDRDRYHEPHPDIRLTITKDERHPLIQVIANRCQMSYEDLTKDMPNYLSIGIDLGRVLYWVDIDSWANSVPYELYDENY